MGVPFGAGEGGVGGLGAHASAVVFGQPATVHDYSSSGSSPLFLVTWGAGPFFVASGEAPLALLDQLKSDAIMDVSPRAVEEAFRAHACSRMIHGHTHRPACHAHRVDGRVCERWVLSDWFENIYVRTAGPEMYDQLATHEIPWTDKSVTEALTTMADYFIRCARHFGLPEPPEVDRDEARRVFTPAMWSFMEESKRLRIDRARDEFGFEPHYPDLAAGLAAAAA